MKFSSADALNFDKAKIVSFVKGLRLKKHHLLNPFPKRQILHSSKPKDFADDNFTLYKNGCKFSQWIENTVGTEEIARYEQFLLFPQCFQKSCTAET